MDIPNDLNRLLARLQEVTSQTGQVGENGSPGLRPTSAEIDWFLSQRGFGSDSVIERVEIAQDGVFQCYMFAVRNSGSDDLSLLTMGAEQI